MRRWRTGNQTESEIISSSSGQIPMVTLVQALTVAHYRSFRQAATALGVSQSSISKRITRLEEYLGVLLFDRSTRGVRPTAAGHRFIAEVEQALEILDRAVKTVGMHARGEQGILRVGVYALVAGGFLDTLLERFHALYGQVALQITEGSARTAQIQLREDQLDVAFMVFTHEIPDLHSRVLWRDRLMTVMSDNHPLAAREAVEWKNLSQETFVVRETGTGPQVHDLIIVRCAGRWPVPIIRRFDVGRDSLLSMIAKGHGVSLLASEQATLAPPGLAFMPIQDEPEAVAFSAVWSPSNRSPALRKLLALAEQMSRSQRSA